MMIIPRKEEYNFVGRGGRLERVKSRAGEGVGGKLIIYKTNCLQGARDFLPPPPPDFFLHGAIKTPSLCSREYFLYLVKKNPYWKWPGLYLSAPQNNSFFAAFLSSNELGITCV